jgi:DNA-binding HxlR family transcriptional regulator
VVTPKSRELLPLLREALRWGMRHVPGTVQLSEQELRDFDRLA